MRNKFKQLLKSNQGDALIFGIFMLILVMTLFCCLLTFVQAKATITYVRNTSQSVLDIYTTAAARDWANSVKNGSDFNLSLDNAKYKNQLKAELGVSNDFIGRNGDKIRFQLSDIQISYTIENRLKTQVSYHLYMPFYFMGAKVTELNANVKLESLYSLK